MSSGGPTELASRLSGSVVFTDACDLLGYQRDCSVVRPGDADLAIRPRSTEEVQTALAAAYDERTPVYVRGGGSMYAGGVNPHAGGLVVDTAGMDRVLELDLDRGVVVVEPGIRFGALLARLAPHGQTVGIVPSTGPTATVGGAVSAHALGTGSPRHQSMGDTVAGVEVVLADGTRLRTGSAACDGAGFFQRYCIGPDLTGLFLGADASFGVVTAIALWLRRPSAPSSASVQARMIEMTAITIVQVIPRAMKPACSRIHCTSKSATANRVTSAARMTPQTTTSLSAKGTRAE